MANTIKIKRSAVTATPTSLAEGELAYSELSDYLFIGSNGGLDIDVIGGKADHDLLVSIDGDHVDLTTNQTIAGEKTFSNDVVINADLTVTGTTTTVDSTVVTVADNIMVLNEGETGAGVSLGSAGIEIDRGTLPNTSWVFDETTDQWGFTTFSGSPLGVFTPVANAVHNHDGYHLTFDSVIDGGTF